ncbi:hypothetical protein V5O48_009709 [Marasmius crinis-equi]|uniref:Uncharacterized protein n=1 Tax=Marasmius crinis-equi TaxID=585013 RepID=A0ABR3FAG2_9AGAR
MPQLCFAFQRWNDIDVARNIYYNITLEKLTFIKLMQEREAEYKVRSESWSLGIADLINTAEYMRNVSQQMDARFEVQTREIGGNLSFAFANLERRAGDVLDSSMDSLSQNFGLSLGNMMSNLDEAVRLRLEKVFGAIQEQQRVSTKTTIAFANQWRATQGEFWAMQESISEVSRLLSQVAVESVNSRNHAIELRQVQREMGQSILQLVTVVDQITNQTRSHFNDINETASDLKQNLLNASGTLKASRWWTDWWMDRLIMVYSLIFRVDSSQVLDILRSPNFVLLRALFAISSQILRSTFSLLAVKRFDFRYVWCRSRREFIRASSSSSFPRGVVQIPISLPGNQPHLLPHQWIRLHWELILFVILEHLADHSLALAPSLLELHAFLIISATQTAS